MDTLPTEIHAYICEFLTPIGRMLTRCAWAGFARALLLKYDVPDPMDFNTVCKVAAATNDFIQFS